MVVRPGHPSPSLEDVRVVATAAGLARFKQPTRLFVWPEAQLPRGDTGKPLKRSVREWAARIVTRASVDGVVGAGGPRPAPTPVLASAPTSKL